MKDYEYIFLERWVLAATPAEVYAALADFDQYTRWGYPAYFSARREGPVAAGSAGKIVVQGGLPYKVNLDCAILELQPERLVSIDVTGDVIGKKMWMIRPFGEGTELISDWRCDPSWAFFRALTPVFKPLFRWNHGQCINTAVAGLAQYLHHERERASAATPPRRPRSAPHKRAAADRAATAR
jgi:hypothetical protein